jgi:alanine racemase
VPLNIATPMPANAPANSEDESIRPTRVEVDLGQLGRNLQTIRQHVGAAKVMAVVKANAYGHGLVPVAREMVKGGADSLGVALLEEAVILREAGITAPILVFGGIAETQIPIFIRNDLTLTAPSIDKLNLIDNAAAAMGVTARVHLKIDTGMERLGIHYYMCRWRASTRTSPTPTPLT